MRQNRRIRQNRQNRSFCKEVSTFIIIIAEVILSIK
ncbi:hypothetical protein SAJRA307_03810 [Staphylococcus aureus]|nr:hypothetical protein SAJRA307_03810 [Staphylococcus aureus]